MSTLYVASSGLTALTAATAKTLVEYAVGANVPAALVGMTVSSSYLTTATPLTLTVELMTYSASGTGTAHTPKRVGGVPGTAQGTAKINDSVEPATPTVIYAWDLTVPGDRLDYQWPLGREFYFPVSTFNGIRVTAPVGTPSVRVGAWIEE